MQQHAALFLVALAIGCGGNTDLNQNPDPDAGTVADAGSNPADTGTVVPDAGTVNDSGTATDTGTAMDSGTATDSGTEMDAGSETDAGTETDAGAMGACTNPADEMVHANTDVTAGVEECARGCFGGRPCTRDCVNQDVGLTLECADCYAAATQCTIQNCLSECSGADSPACEQCRDDSGCTAEFHECAGI